MNFSDFIGNTPIIKLNKEDDSSSATIWAKLENLNFNGAHTDRVAIAAIEKAEKENLISSGVTTLVEHSDGNMGISLACFCREKGYKLIVVVPNYINEERINNINAYEAEVVSDNNPKEKALELIEKNNDYYLINKVEEDIRENINYLYTADEIINQVEGNIEAFVCGYRAGGLFPGVSRKLKEYYPDIKIVAVEPKIKESTDDKEKNNLNIYGIDLGTVPSKIDEDLVDEICHVDYLDAKEGSMYLAKHYGLLVGISSGALYSAAISVGKKLGKGKQVLTVFYDTGERYLSLGLYRK